MSERQRFIRPAVQANPRLVGEMLRRVATALDAADDGHDITFYVATDLTSQPVEYAIAWSHAALLIADMADVTTLDLRALAVTIDKGEQRVLFT